MWISTQARCVVEALWTNAFIGKGTAARSGHRTIPVGHALATRGSLPARLANTEVAMGTLHTFSMDTGIA